MAEHYTRNTVTAMAWCGPCGKRTPHRGGEVKLGACLECEKRLDDEHTARVEADYDFEERAAILEFEAGLSREEAEQRAREEMQPRNQKALFS